MVYQVSVDSEDSLDQSVLLERLAAQENLDPLVHQDNLDRGENQDHRDHRERRDFLEALAFLDHLDHLDHQDLMVGFIILIILAP